MNQATNGEHTRNKRLMLIAHRGGVIGPDAPENSLAAIRLAAERGYDMVELDVREALDGEPVLFHGQHGNLEVDCGVNSFVHELTSAELGRIRYRASDQYIPTLDRAHALCKRLGLKVMLDIKLPEGTTVSPDFIEHIGRLLSEHGLADGSLALSAHPTVRQHLPEGTRFPLSGEEMRQLLAGEPSIGDDSYWFGFAHMLGSAETVKSLRQSVSPIIVSINTHNYPIHAHYELARADIERCAELGVDSFQIDSVYQELVKSVSAVGLGM